MTNEMKVIKKLIGGNTDATVELVEIDAKYFVLKTLDLSEAVAEKFFNDELKTAKLPTLRHYTDNQLKDNQLLLEYIIGSKTLGKNINVEDCQKWGYTMRAIHDIRYPYFFTLDNNFKKIKKSWNEYISTQITIAIKKYSNYHSDPGMPAIKSLKEKLSKLAEYQPVKFSLVHGDLHVHNVLLRGNEILLYDKSSSIYAAPPMYDLATIYSEGFPGGSYANIDERHRHDPDLLSAFMKGYGSLDEEDSKWLDHFILLRSMLRYPNAHAPRLKEVIITVESRLAS